jgi:peroxiredoxin
MTHRKSYNQPLTHNNKILKGKHPMVRSKKPEAIEKIEEEDVRRKVGARWKEAVLLLILLVLVAFVAVYFLSREKGRQEVKIIGVSDKAPEFSLPAVDGKPIGLSGYRGKVVMVHFWATWCPPCVEEMPTLDALYRAMKGKDLEVLAISADEDGAGAVTAFMRKNKLTLPVLFDPGGTVASSYGTFRLPETYIVDREGVVRYKEIGARDWSVPESAAIVRNIIEMK